MSDREKRLARIRGDVAVTTADDKANRFMIAKLQELKENGRITNSFDEEFIESVANRMEQGLPLTEKQQNHLNTCFHDRYN